MEMKYVHAGVNIREGEKISKEIAKLAENTHQHRVIPMQGGFGGLYSLSDLNMKEPVLVSSTDSVGTKILIAQKMKRFDTFSFEVPSFKPVILTVKQVKRDKNQGPFPDLAVASYDCERDGSNLRVRVSNVGAAPSKKTSLVIYNDRGKKIAEKAVPVISAPLYYVEKSVMIEFSGIPSSRTLRNRSI